MSRPPERAVPSLHKRTPHKHIHLHHKKMEDQLMARLDGEVAVITGAEFAPEPARQQLPLAG
jgi:hypothetical protein